MRLAQFKYHVVLKPWTNFLDTLYCGVKTWRKETIQKTQAYMTEKCYKWSKIIKENIKWFHVLQQWPVAGYCANGNEILGYRKYRDFLIICGANNI